MSLHLNLVLMIPLALAAEVQPPVILVDGWYPNCTRAPRTSQSTFGQMEAKLNAMGIATQYFRPCSVPAQTGFARATVEELGQALGALIDATIQQNSGSQVDVIAFSIGSPTVRAYLTGMQNAPGGFQPREDPRIRKLVFLGGLFFGVGNGHAPTEDPQDDAACTGTPFQCRLNTWDQGGGDLRGIDAVAVAGSGQPTPVAGGVTRPIGGLLADGDGVASVTTSSLTFAYPAERTRIIKACHVSEVCMPTVSFVDSDSHPAWLIVKSFLSGTDEWKAVGSTPDQDATQSRNGGVFVAVKDASDHLIDAGSVSLGAQVLDRDTKSGPGLFYLDQVAKGQYILQATAGIPVPDVSFSPTPGTYSMVTMKPGPLISSVVPAAGIRQPSIPAGSAIEIRGARLSTVGSRTADPPFPTSLEGTTVLLNGQPIPLQAVAESSVNAQLPAHVTGFARLNVTTAEGTHGLNLFIDAADGPGPRATYAGVVNAASFVSGPVAPGELITIFGRGLGPAELVPYQLSPGGRRLTSLVAGTRVIFDGIAAPIVYTSATQVSAVVPWTVGQTTTEMHVEYNEARGNRIVLPVAAAAPAIFTTDPSGQGAILNQDFSVNGPARPAAKGSVVMVYGTGGGEMTASAEDGAITSADPAWLRQTVTAKIGGVDAPVLYSGAAPYMVSGIMQVNVRVPDNLPGDGSLPIALFIDGKSAQAGVTLAVGGKANP